MIKPIPPRILKQTVTLRVCSAIDAWQTPTWTNYTISHVCIQPTHETAKTKENTEVALKSVLFIDARLSTPNLDINALQVESEKNGVPCAVEHTQGTTVMKYTVLGVDTLFDDRGNVHHYEVRLV